MKILSFLKAACRHRMSLRNALSSWTSLWSGDGVIDALGGLTKEEKDGLVDWIAAADARQVVEIGTLFGFTAREIVRRTRAKVTAVDNFCWNPFGMPPDTHESFAREILADFLADGRVELLRTDSERFFASADDGRLKGAFVFLDGDHRYEAVRREIELVRKSGAAWIAGHDYGNPLFGVTRAVGEAFGKPDATAGMCWLKRLQET